MIFKNLYDIGLHRKETNMEDTTIMHPWDTV